MNWDWPVSRVTCQFSAAVSSHRTELCAYAQCSFWVIPSLRSWLPHSSLCEDDILHNSTGDLKRLFTTANGGWIGMIVCVCVCLIWFCSFMCSTCYAKSFRKLSILFETQKTISQKRFATSQQDRTLQRKLAVVSIILSLTVWRQLMESVSPLQILKTKKMHCNIIIFLWPQPWQIFWKKTWSDADAAMSTSPCYCCYACQAFSSHTPRLKLYLIKMTDLKLEILRNL